MTANIAQLNQSITQTGEFTREQIDLIKQQCARGTSDLEFKHFLQVAQMRRLNPLAAQLHCIVRGQGDNRKMTIQVSIDGLRLIAERTGEYAGYDPPKLDFAKPDGSTDNRIPYSCEITVYRIVQGQRCGFPAIAFFDEFCPTNEKEAWMWKKMPRLMLIKCTMAQALRSAFPQELSSFYGDEEMDQAGQDDWAGIQPEKPQVKQIIKAEDYACNPNTVESLIATCRDAKAAGVTGEELKRILPKGRTGIKQLSEDEAQRYLDEVSSMITIVEEARSSEREAFEEDNKR